MSHVEHAVRNIVSLYVTQGKMFTVYQIWCDAQAAGKGVLDYNEVRRVIESIINDNYSTLSGWTRTVGNHLRNLDNNVGKAGEAPQIYHRVNDNILNYDPNFRIYNATVVSTPNTQYNRTGLIVASPISKPKKKKSNKKGLFKFKVWLNGGLVNCNFVNPRGQGGKFVSNQDYEGYGVLDNGQPVLVRQDHQGKLYATSVN